MKRSHEQTAASRGSGPEANLPWPKRMATDVSASATVATAAAGSRFGFGFRGSITAKSNAMSGAIDDGTTPTSNQTETSDGIACNTKVGPEAPERDATKDALAVVDATENLRGRGRTAHRQRSLPRPNVGRATGATAKAEIAGASSGLTVPISGPRSTSRLGLKQTATIAMRRASESVSASQSSTVLSRRASEQAQQIKTENKFLMGKENNDPVGQSVLRSVLAFDAFVTSRLAAETIESNETLLQLRLKAKKFDMKNRVEEAQSHNRQLKGGLRQALDDEKAVIKEWNTTKAQIEADVGGHEARLKRLHTLVTEKDMQLLRANQEMDGMRRECDLADTRVRDLTQRNKQLLEEQQQASRVRTELESSNQKLQTQLHQAQKQNDELTLELRAHQTTMSDRVMLYEEKKKELEHFYHRKDSEEDKRKSSEIERLHARLSEVREEMAAANQEKESYRQRSFAADEETRKERDRCGQLEREKYTIEAQHRSLEERLSQSLAEMTQMKAKLDQKDQEISGLVQSLTEIQKLNAVSSSKIDSEKKDLTDKIEQLQNQLREIERNEATNGSVIRELRGQAEEFAAAKAAWAEKQLESDVRVKDLELQLQHSSRDLSVEAGVRQMLESQNRELRTENTATNAQTEALRYEMKRLQSAHEEAKANWQMQLTSASERLNVEKASLCRQIETLQEEKVSIESEVKTLRERVANVRDGDFEELCTVKREAEVLRLRLQEMSNHGFQSIAQKDRLIEELQEKVRVGEKTRRTLHNTIQELRGNVRVFARTRPFLPSDGLRDADNLTPAVSCEFDGQTVKLKRQAKTTSGNNDQDTYAFTFDKVFSPSSGQDNIFEEVSEFVQSSIDGYHVCLFSYGQTGSGKTHTMQGSGNGQMRGIIPRAIEKVLAVCAVLKDHGWNYTMHVSFLEIYNETLKDLLVTKEDTNKVLSIKKDAKGGVHVPELTLVGVTEMAQVEKLMERASRARSVACTDMNAQSSRSHSVFTLHLQGVNDSEGIMLDGKLNLVDLAGSERASRSGVSGERLKETQAINKSLSCLADVFTAIGNKSAHIPFRNSKLTYLLQSSLSGDGKTLMMVNVSPTIESSGETLCSLRFAQQVNKCELGKPKRQIKSKKEA